MIFCDRLYVNKAHMARHLPFLRHFLQRKKSDVYFRKKCFFQFGFRVLSSMKGTLEAVSDFSYKRPGHISDTLLFLSLRYSVEFRGSPPDLYYHDVTRPR